jgi:ethanolamine utilization protein EutA
VLPAPLLPAGERIRATVLGASAYTVQLSGNTCFISDPAALLPRRNLQVLRPRYHLNETVDPEEIATAIRTHLAKLAGDQDIALALGWHGPPSYERVAGFARGIADGTTDCRSLYLMLDGDLALTLGTLLHDELGVTSDLLVIDGLSLGDFDYVDLGAPRQPSNTVPVTIKSLVFSEELPSSQLPLTP